MSTQIRVLHVLSAMGRGGAETMVMNLYRNIDRNKVQFDFIVHTEKVRPYDKEIESLGGRIFRVPRYQGSNHLQYKEAWKRFFEDNPEYRIIHGHVRSTASIYLRIAKNFGLVTIAHSHNTSSGKGVAAFAKNILQLPIRNVADYLFACSEYAGEWLFGKKVKKRDNYYIIKNAIDTKQFIFNKDIRLIKRKEFEIEDKFIIGHVGRFHKQKNHEFLIDIFKEIVSQNEKAILLLVGDGELKQCISDKVNKLGLSEKVIFTGVRTDIPELLQAMDVFLLPSLHEGLPVTLIEAQASGLPCVISSEITKEVAITELVKFVSLEANIYEWAKLVLEYSDKSYRYDMSNEIVNAGYDIEATSNWYQNFIKSRVN